MKEMDPSSEGLNSKCIIIIITIIIIIIIIYHCTQCIYNYVPGTNHVYSVRNVAAILCLHFMVHVKLLPMLNVLYFYISAFLSTCAVPSIAVFCSSLISCFPLHMNFLNDFKMVSFARIINGVTFIFTCHTRCTSILRSSYYYYYHHHHHP